MDLFDAIASRYSYRGSFTDSPVSRQDLEKIVQAGIRAPSACNQQIASFVIVDDPALLGEIAQIVDKPVCHTAKAMIACVADPRPVYADLRLPRKLCGSGGEHAAGHHRPGLCQRVARWCVADGRPRGPHRPAPRRSDRPDDPHSAAHRRARRARETAREIFL